MGTAALMGIGVGRGENRARDAAQAAIKSPLLETSINGATHAIINIASNAQLTMYEIDLINREIKAGSQTDLNIWWGNQLNPRLTDEIVVTVIATGFPDDGSKSFQSSNEEKLGLFVISLKYISLIFFLLPIFLLMFYLHEE